MSEDARREIFLWPTGRVREDSPPAREVFGLRLACASPALAWAASILTAMKSPFAETGGSQECSSPLELSSSRVDQTWSVRTQRGETGGSPRISQHSGPNLGITKGRVS